MSVLKLLLVPFSIIYTAITDFRNHLYDIKYKYSVQFDRFVISVGNLTVGGTGKTPFVELLIRYLKDKHKMAILSRGYGRKTRGFRLAGKKEDATTLGDEPFQYFIKYGQDVTVAVGEERATAIPEILLQQDDIELIVLDDAYQHRSVTPNLNILLNDYFRPFYKDRVMPAGWLRESRKHARRADQVIVTKCPADLGQNEMQQIEEKIQHYAGRDKPVYFTGIKYLEPQRMLGEQAFSNNVYLFSGIANHQPLEEYVSKHFNLLGHQKFHDHHAFTTKDLDEIRKQFNQVILEEKSLLTTEKDMVRILSVDKQFLSSYSVFYLPIELYFLKNEDSFAKNLDVAIAREGLKNR